MEAYANKLVRGVYEKINSPFDITDTPMKLINTGTGTTVDTEVILNRTLGIIGSGEFDLHGVFSYELAPIPKTLLLDDGRMRPASSWSTTQNGAPLNEKHVAADRCHHLILRVSYSHRQQSAVN